MKRWSRAALAYAGPCLFVFGLMETWHPRDILMEASTSPITCFHSVNMSLYLKDFISLPLPTVRRTYHETRCWKWRARLWKLESSWSQFWICCFGRFGRWKDFDCFTKGLATSPPMAGTTNMESELWRWWNSESKCQSVKVHVNFVDSVLHSGEREDGTKQSAQLQLARTVAICSIYSKLPPHVTMGQDTHMCHPCMFSQIFLVVSRSAGRSPMHKSLSLRYIWNVQPQLPSNISQVPDFAASKYMISNGADPGESQKFHRFQSLGKHEVHPVLVLWILWHLWHLSSRSRILAVVSCTGSLQTLIVILQDAFRIISGIVTQLVSIGVFARFWLTYWWAYYGISLYLYMWKKLPKVDNQGWMMTHEHRSSQIFSRRVLAICGSRWLPHSEVLVKHSDSETRKLETMNNLKNPERVAVFRSEDGWNWRKFRNMKWPFFWVQDGSSPQWQKIGVGMNGRGKTVRTE